MRKKIQEETNTKGESQKLSPFFSAEFRQTALLVVITALGFGFRVYHLDYHGLWLDEGSSYVFSSAGIKEILTRITETNPPLYYLLLHFWMKLFGTSEFSLRFPSVLFGTACIPLTAMVGFMAANRRTGLLAALFMAVMVFPIHYSQEARAYTFFLMMNLFSCLFFLKILDKNRKKDWYFYIISTAVLFYTHYYCVFVILAQNLYFFLFYKNHKKVLSGWLAAQTVVLLLSLPWLIVLLNQSRRTLHYGSWLHKTDLSMFFVALRSYVAYLIQPHLLWIFLWIGLLGLSGLKNLQSTAFLLLWFLCPILIPILVSLIKEPIFIFRYTLGAIPPLYLFLSQGVWQIPSRVFRIMLAGALIFITGASLNNYYADKRDPHLFGKDYFRYPVEAWREAVKYLQQHKKPGDIVIVGGGTHAFQYYAGQELEGYSLHYQVFAENSDSIKNKLDELTPGKTRMWVLIRKYSVTKAKPLLEFLEERYPKLPFGTPEWSERLQPSIHLFDLTQATQAD